MKTDGLFTVHEVRIPVVRAKGETIRLIVWGDVHRDSPNHADGEWESFLDYAKAQKDSWFLGVGDYLDSTSTSERACLGRLTHEMHETFLKDMAALQDAKVELLGNELAFMRGRLIGLLNGNHYFSFQDGTNTDQRLCRMLDCPYLGVSSFIRLRFVYRSKEASLDVWAHHGAGAGRLLGGSINRVDQMREHAQADIYVMGHDHKRCVVPSNPRLYLDHHSKAGLRVLSQQQWLVRSGSFLKSYTPGERSYNVDAARGPCSLGHVELLISPHFTNAAFAGFDIRGLS